jgi:iron-sulfur cluster assembly protein
MQELCRAVERVRPSGSNRNVRRISAQPAIVDATMTSAAQAQPKCQEDDKNCDVFQCRGLKKRRLGMQRRPAHDLLCLKAAKPLSWKSDMLHLTDSALNAVQTAISGATDPVDGLRIMVEAGGCAGFQYKMGLVREASPDDTVIERGGVKVFIDNSSHELLAGTTIDYVVAVQGSGFTFENPNAQSSCSCGKSFG